MPSLPRSLLCLPFLLLPSCAEAGRERTGPASTVPDASVPSTPPAPVDTQLRDPTAEDYRGPRLPRGRVTLKDGAGKSHVVEVEIAATHAARTRGLMWRTKLADGQGMLFVFPGESLQSFWMRNTLIPLDMLYLSSSGEVVTIIERAEPHSLTSRPSTKPAKYVLEVPGGWAGRNGIRVGAKAEFEGTSMLRVE